MRWWTLRKLRSRNAQNRVSAILEIKTWENSEALEKILPLLSDEDTGVLKTAMDVIYDINKNFDIKGTPLRKTTLYSQAVEALVRTISRLGILCDLGMQASHVLESIADIAMLKLYADNKGPESLAVTFILASKGDTSVLEKVKERLEDTSDKIQKQAQSALLKLLPANKVEELVEGATIKRYKRWHSEKDLASLRTFLRRSSPLRRKVLIELALPTLIESLQHLWQAYHDGKRLFPLFELLSEIGDPRAIEPILNIPIGPVWPSSMWRYEALKKMRFSPAVLGEFCLIIEKHNGSIVERILEDMCLKEELTAEILAPYLVRIFKSDVSGDLIDDLIATLNRTRCTDIKIWVIYCLASLGDERALQPVISVLADDSILHISRLYSTRWEPIRDRDYIFFVKEMQDHVIDGLKRITSRSPHIIGRAIDLLVAMLSEKSDNYGKMLLVLGLAAVGDHTAVGPLINILTDKTLHPRAGNTLGANEPLEWTQIAVISSLKRITGKDFPNIEEWHTWWKHTKDKDTQF